MLSMFAIEFASWLSCFCFLFFVVVVVVVLFVCLFFYSDKLGYSLPSGLRDEKDADRKECVKHKVSNFEPKIKLQEWYYN